MTTVLVNAGESVQIRFTSDRGQSLDDGGFEVHYDSPQHPKHLLIKETDGLPGSIKGAANEVLYDEEFPSPEQKDIEETEPFEPR